MIEFWRVRLGKVTVYDWSLEEALASLLRVKQLAAKMKRH